MSRVLPRLGFILAVSFWYFGIASLGFAQSDRSLLVKEHFTSKNYQKVVDVLEPNIEHLSKEELLLLGKSYTFLKNPNSAAKAYLAILANDPKNSDGLALLGGAYLSLKKEKEGLSSLKEALSADPKNKLAYGLLIEHYRNKSNRYELRLIYEDMMTHLGESDESITQLCELYTNGGLYDLAKKTCNRGIEMNPKVAENYVNLALTQKATGSTDEAEKTYQRSVKLFPKSLVVLIGYAKHQEEQKKFLNAFNFYKKALKIDDQSIEAAIGTGLSGIELQKFNESLVIFQKYCGLNKEGLTGFRKALSLLRSQKNNPSVKQWLSKYEAALGRCEKF
jgi:tetratricopeptide (TPR) repeat protein